MQHPSLELHIVEEIMKKHENWWDHTPANYITITRVIMGLFGLSAYLWDTSYLWYGFTVYALACIFDAVDGYIARTWHCESWSGRLMDPIADRIMEWSSYAVIAHYTLVSELDAHFRQGVLLCIGLIVLYGVGTTLARAFNAKIQTSKIAKQKQVVLFIAINTLLFAIASSYTRYVELSESLFFMGSALLVISTIACALSALTYVGQERRHAV